MMRIVIVSSFALVAFLPLAGCATPEVNGKQSVFCDIRDKITFSVLRDRDNCYQVLGLDSSRTQQARAKAARAEKEAAEMAERIKAERAQAQQAEMARAAAQATRIEAERAAAERIKAERAQAQQAEMARAAEQARRIEAESRAKRIKAERAQAQQAEMARAAEQARIIEAEKRITAERVAADRIKAERAQAQQAEMAPAAEQATRNWAERVVAERIKRIKAEGAVAASSKTVTISFDSQPSGALLIENDTGNSFELPHVASYENVPIQSDGCVYIRGVTVRWISGVKWAPRALKFCGDAVAYEKYIPRPKDAPGIKLDLQQEARAKAARAEKAATAERLQAQGAEMARARAQAARFEAERAAERAAAERAAAERAAAELAAAERAAAERAAAERDQRNDILLGTFFNALARGLAGPSTISAPEPLVPFALPRPAPVPNPMPHTPNARFDNLINSGPGPYNVVPRIEPRPGNVLTNCLVITPNVSCYSVR